MAPLIFELTTSRILMTMESMNPTETHLIAPELMAELHKAAHNAAKGVRDPETMKKACERMDRLRLEIFKKHGTLDIGVPSLRELRDE